MTSPFISVIITAYKRKQFIRHALDSALQQTLCRSSYELIVTKDFHEAEIDEEIAQKGITGIMFDSSSIGRRTADALKYAKGEVIAFLDDDDLWDPEKLSHVYRIFSSEPDLVFYHNAQSYIDESGNKVGALKGWDPNKNVDELGGISFQSSELKKCDSLKLMHMYLTFNASSIAVRREILENHIQLLSSLDSAPDDFLLFAALDSGKKIMADGRRLTQYRIHIDNVSSVKSAEPGHDISTQDYRIRQSNAYMEMKSAFWTSTNIALRLAFRHALNYVNLVRILGTTTGSRKEMAVVAIAEAASTFRYILCNSHNCTFKARKFGLGYNLRLTLLSILFVISPSLARAIYSDIYVR